MGRSLLFPQSGRRSPDNPAVMCTAERVLGLYKQSTGKKATNVSATVRTWFKTEARKHGWTGVEFLPEATSQKSAGCVLWVRQHRAGSIAPAAVALVLFGADQD